MYIQRIAVPAVTDAGGNATVYSESITGVILGIVYVKTDFTDGVDVVVTAETTAQPIVTMTDVNASAVFYPRSATHDVTGAPAVFAVGGAAVREPVPVANERVKFVVSSGGNTKSGTFYVLVG